jgi:hypothetical protein
MTKHIIQNGDIVWAVINLKVKKYNCVECFGGFLEKHITLVPYKQNRTTFEQFKPIYQVNGLEEYVFTNWKSARIYQIKQILNIIKRIFK